jgi:hypothetical protein
MIGGKTMYGKVDQVPGKYYVGTMFVHGLFFPGLPCESYLVRYGHRGSGWSVVAPLPLSLKSVLFAYIRAILFVVLMFSLVTVSLTWYAGAREFRQEHMFHYFAIPISAILLWGSYQLSRASEKRALELAELVAANQQQTSDFEQAMGT